MVLCCRITLRAQRKKVQSNVTADTHSCKIFYNFTVTEKNLANCNPVVLNV